MGKFVLLAVFLATLVAVSVAQSVSEQSFRDAQCRREVQEKPLYACQQILHQHLTGGGHEGAVSVRPLQKEWDTRDLCCRQLHGVSRGCRCSAIRGMVRDYEQAMPPLGQGRRGSPGEQPEQGYCGGETAEHHQQGGGCDQQGQVLRHERPQRQQQGEAGQGYCGGETAESQQRQHGEAVFYGETSRRQQGEILSRQFGRVGLMKGRRYAAGLPIGCQIEPMECSVFSADQY
ncbi:19 kDa globulin-like [Lolium perenne]|uniref:19 kDa globulin-like n=1 Tax=Lolium perenne TaxID=4522 RepID=UPI0021F53093|nr:19 kDa globulin-like [Lolium perenne]